MDPLPFRPPPPPLSARFLEPRNFPPRASTRNPVLGENARRGNFLYPIEEREREKERRSGRERERERWSEHHGPSSLVDQLVTYATYNGGKRFRERHASLATRSLALSLTLSRLPRFALICPIGYRAARRRRFRRGFSRQPFGMISLDFHWISSDDDDLVEFHADATRDTKPSN